MHDRAYLGGLPKPTYEELLNTYGRWKKVRQFAQIDAWHQGQSEFVFKVDEEGDIVNATWTWDLRGTDFPLRIQIPVGADKETVLRLLAKAYRLVVEDFESVTTPPDPSTWSEDEFPF